MYLDPKHRATGESAPVNDIDFLRSQLYSQGQRIEELSKETRGTSEKIGQIAPLAEVWQEDHEAIIKAKGVKELLLWMTPFLQVVILGMLAWAGLLLIAVDKQQGKNIDAIASLKEDREQMRAAIAARTFVPEDWDVVRAAVAQIPGIVSDMKVMRETLDKVAREKASTKPVNVTVRQVEPRVVVQPIQLVRPGVTGAPRASGSPSQGVIDK